MTARTRTGSGTRRRSRSTCRTHQVTGRNSFSGWRVTQRAARNSARAAEIAAVVAFLAFEATFSTGAEFPVDGGAAQL